MATVPDAPGPFVITSYTNLRVNGKATAGNDGGSPILEWELAWGTHPTAATASGTLNSNGTGFVSGLVPGGTYYFWNRQRNAVGWSKLSAVTKITMKSPPDPPRAPTLVRRTQTAMTIAVSPNYNGGAPITSYRIVYGLSPTNSDNVLVDTGQQALFHLTDLDPGKTYYFWTKATNMYGESEWSARSSLNLLAGAWIKKGATWKRAVPYVRVGGVWVMVRPWVKVAGVWKEVAD